MSTAEEVPDETRYDLVVFGATGYTGNFTVEEVARTAVKQGITWAVAGRSRSKLEKVLKDASDATKLDLSSVPVIIADVGSEESLSNMAQQARVVINTVGPYRFYGEAVVKACVENGTSHVDVSGEPQYLESMQLKYDKAASEKNVYIVGSCGFDSIPADMGVVYMAEKFGGDLNSVTSFLKMGGGEGESGPSIHDGTWKSLVHGMGHMKELGELRKKLFPEPLPRPAYRQPKMGYVHFSEQVKSWCLPFLGSDRSVVSRSQRFFYNTYKQRPVQMSAYMQMASWFQSVLMVLGFAILTAIAQFKGGRALMVRFPRVFSLGTMSDEGMSRERNEKSKFTMTLIGSGWGEKLAEPTDQHKEPPNKTLVVKVKGTNPGYGATCICLVQAAMTILKEANKMPGSGGVLPPGAAFSKTTLISRLQELGVTFEEDK